METSLHRQLKAHYAGADGLQEVVCDGYRIEKVHYESRPNHHVTGNLYLPDRKKN